MWTKSLAGVAAVAVAVTAADAAALGLDFTDALVGTGPATTRTAGWRFNLLDSLTIDKLGVFDFAFSGDNTLADDHDVGIWLCDDAACGDGTLQVQGTVFGSASATPSDDFEVSASGVGAWVFEDVPDTLLPAGEYVVGAFYPSADDVVVLAIDPATLITDPAVSYAGRRFTPESADLSFPFRQVAGVGFFGPNFRIASPDPIPAPGPLVPVGLSLLVLAGLRFGRSR